MLALIVTLWFSVLLLTVDIRTWSLLTRLVGVKCVYCWAWTLSISVSPWYNFHICLGVKNTSSIYPSPATPTPPSRRDLSCYRCSHVSHKPWMNEYWHSSFRQSNVAVSLLYSESWENAVIGWWSDSGGNKPWNHIDYVLWQLEATAWEKVVLPPKTWFQSTGFS